MAKNRLPDEVKEPAVTPEEIAAEREAAADGSQDILSAMIGYAKRYSGYPFVSASRIERIADPEKKEKSSFLFDQMSVNFMARNKNSGPKDFMEVFGSGKLVFIQAHASCPTLGADGLYNAMDIDGKFIKTQLVGYFALSEDKKVETQDERSVSGYEYFYKDANDQFMGIEVNDDTVLAEYYKKHGTLYRALKIPFFEPIIVIKQGMNKFGKIVGNPYPPMPTEVAAALLKNATLTEVPEPPAK